jgi:hypothetical protein
MRQFLAGIQGMLEAAERGDAAAIAKIARPLGMAAAHNVPAGLAAKLPLEFKTLWPSVHADFDRIAMDAEAMNDARLSLRQLGETMKNASPVTPRTRLRPCRLPSGSRRKSTPPLLGISRAAPRHGTVTADL